MLHLRCLDKQEQLNPKQGEERNNKNKGQNKQNRDQRNHTKNQQNKSLFFENINKTDKLLENLT
jgi:hypothetical protein